ncbi:MAG: hypothetical protein V3T31_10010 [candidate division Zixibacteria bacterium]
MITKSRLLVVAVLLAPLLFAFGASAQANTNLRGKVVTFNRSLNRQTPISRKQIVLVKYNQTTRKNDIVAKTVTDRKGMYYLYGISPGSYTLRVMVGKTYSKAVTVRPPVSNRTFQDIELIKLK